MNLAAMVEVPALSVLAVGIAVVVYTWGLLTLAVQRDQLRAKLRRLESQATPRDQ